MIVIDVCAFRVALGRYAFANVGGEYVSDRVAASAPDFSQGQGLIWPPSGKGRLKGTLAVIMKILADQTRKAVSSNAHRRIVFASIAGEVRKCGRPEEECL